MQNMWGQYYEGFLNRHNKTKYHLTALAKLNSGSESASETSQIKDYSKKKDYYSEVVLCPSCGMQCTRRNLARHKRSLRHHIPLP